MIGANNVKAKNLITVYQGEAAIANLGYMVDRKYKILKEHEIKCLEAFCTIMEESGCEFKDFDNFFVGYSIGQIGKEFDMLRFGIDSIINIELKSELNAAVKEEKVLKQMRVNYYYLKFLDREIKIFSFVENDGFYEYDIENDSIHSVEPKIIAELLINQNIDYSADPNEMFFPSNYLISPFNSTEKFINNEYFLTNGQQKIKDEIKKELSKNPFMFFCISANAGTGKTLLMYDIAKDFIVSGYNILIIHCGKLNDGHSKLITKYSWNINPISWIPKSLDSAANFDLSEYKLVLIDESQRIRDNQLEVILNKSIEKQIPIIFSYDVKQFLKNGETKDIGNYLEAKYPNIKVSKKELNKKIRTNKELASFIANLVHIGKSTSNLNYSCVSIDYISNFEDLKKYLSFLKSTGWMPITYTTSQYNPDDPYLNLSQTSYITAHDVIGQEFPKVILIMDNNFYYDLDGNLTARSSYYSASGMLYQIVTRVVDNLKIIVLDNPELYFKLLEIKSMGGLNSFISRNMPPYILVFIWYKANYFL